VRDSAKAICLSCVDFGCLPYLRMRAAKYRYRREVVSLLRSTSTDEMRCGGYERSMGKKVRESNGMYSVFLCRKSTVLQ